MIIVAPLMNFAERTAYAGRMLLIGMGAIFLSLAALWGVLEIFRRLVVKVPDHVQEAPAAPAPVAPAKPITAAPATSNDALIAVITAAVAAAMAEENGGSVPAFRVVSFQKVSTVSKRK